MTGEIICNRIKAKAIQPYREEHQQFPTTKNAKSETNSNYSHALAPLTKHVAGLRYPKTVKTHHIL